MQTAARLVFVAVLLSHASFASELDATELVTEMQEPDDASLSVTYSSVPGFALQDGATSVPDKDKDGCAAVCTGEPTCRSFSYSEESKTCFWSVDSLNFDPAFVMLTKAHHSGDPYKKYRTFTGLTYRAEGWLKVTGKTLDECEVLCTASTTCEALSYREDDMLCLLSPKGVHYAAEFTYYEKSGTKMATMPITTAGGAKMASDETEDKEQAQTNQNEVQALMNAEQDKLNGANEEINSANEMEQKAHQAVTDEEHEMHSELAKAQQDADAQLSSDESKFTAAQAEKMSQEKHTMELQFASAELKEKAGNEETQADTEKERTEKASADVKGHAAREAARAVAEGAEEAAARVETAQLEEKQAQAAQQMNDADEKTQKASLEKQDAVDEVEATKEVAEKKTAASAKDIEEKKAALEGKSDAEKEKGYKEIEEAKEKATAEAHERTIEIESKEQQRSTERGEKAKEETDADEKQNKATLTGTMEERNKDEQAKATEDEKLQQMEKDAMLANVQANAVQVETQVAGEEQKLQSAQALSEAEMDFQKKELAEQIKAKMEREAAAEVEEQRENVAREAAQRVAGASKEEADRVAQEATDSAKRKEISEKDKVFVLEKEVQSEKALEHTKTQEEKDEIEKKIEEEKDEAQSEATKIEEDANTEVKEIEDQAHADAQAKKQEADADAKVTESKAKELGEKQSADIAAASEQASLIGTMTIKADESTFVSSGLNAASASYQDMENNAQAAGDNADEEAQKAAAATQAAQDASAAVSSAENKGKELAEKSATVQSQASQAGSQAASTAAASAAAQAAAQSSGGARRLLGETALDARLRNARHRAVVAMRRLLQTTGGATSDVQTGIAQVQASAQQAAQQANAAAQSLAQTTDEAATKSGVATQLSNNGGAANDAQNELTTKSTANANADATELGTKEVQSKADTQQAEANAKAAAQAQQTTSDQAQAAAETQQAALNAANLLPANTAYGKLPEMFDHKGYLRVQSGGPMEQSAFLKFPIHTIPATDTIIASTLRVYKTGGGGGPAVIKLASCAWTRNTLTYTSSETLPQQTASEGVTSVFPEESDMWASIKLQAAVIQSARANGDHICFEVTGGPQDEPAILSSELTSDAPELKIELQAPPKSEAEKAAEAAKQKAMNAHLQAENDMEEHLRSKYTEEEKALHLAEKAADLPNKVNEIKAEGDETLQASTQGGAYSVLSAEKEAEEAKEITDTINQKTTEITIEENGKMQTTLTDSGLTGAMRTTLEGSLATQTSTNIATMVSAMRTKVENEIRTKYLNELSQDLETKKAEIAQDVADKISTATTTASTLSEAEMQTVSAKADGRTAQGMADWRAGTLSTDDAPASVHHASAAAALAELDSAGLDETAKADMQSKIAQQVEAQVGPLVQTRVAGKMSEATNNAVQEISAQITADSDTQLQADIASQTAGKTASEATTISTTLTNTATDKKNQDITAATTSSALVALKAKLQQDLTTQMHPSVEAELKAKITREELAAHQKEQSEAAANAVSALSQSTTLDSAESFLGEPHNPAPAKH